MKRETSTTLNNKNFNFSDKSIRLIDYLSQRFTYMSEAEWLDCILMGNVKINDYDSTAKFLLSIGDKITCYLTITEPLVNRDFKIIYEDNDFMIVDKPTNLPIHPSGIYFHNTLWNFLNLKGTGYHFINRLDRETCGLVIISKTSQANKNLCKQLENGKIKKKYYAMVHNHFISQLEADGFMGKDKNSSIRKKQLFSFAKLSTKNKQAFTLFQPVSYKNNCSIIRCQPLTGRMHQIRATLQTLGYPIVGDKMYGHDERFYLKFIDGKLSKDDWLKLQRPTQALQCYYYSFTHPTSSKKIEVQIPCEFTLELF